MDDRELDFPEVPHEDEQIYFYLWEHHMNMMLKVERILFPCCKNGETFPLRDLPCRGMLLQFKVEGKPFLMMHYYASKKKVIMDYFKKESPNIIFEIKMTGEFRGKKIRKEFS
jgi:hypothetical protein